MIRALGRGLLGGMSGNEKIKFFDSQMDLNLTSEIWKNSATMVGHAAFSFTKNSTTILERDKSRKSPYKYDRVYLWG